MSSISDIILIGGAAAVAYVYQDEIIQFLKDNHIIDGGYGPCTKTCGLPHSHLDSDACACMCDEGYQLTTEGCALPPPLCNGKTCGSGTVLNPSTCNCDPISVCGGKTCGAGTHLNTTT